MEKKKEAVIRVHIASALQSGYYLYLLFVYVYAMFLQVCLAVSEPDKGLCCDVLLRVQQKRIMASWLSCISLVTWIHTAVSDMTAQRALTAQIYIYILAESIIDKTTTHVLNGRDSTRIIG